jgi:ABC-type lipoprotein release transport system permease subunit
MRHPRGLRRRPGMLGKALVTSPRGERLHHRQGHRPRARERSHRHRHVDDQWERWRTSAGHDEAFAGILIGQELAGELGAFPGDVITLITPQGSLSPMGMMPRQRRVRIVGTVSLGLFEFDQAYGFVDLATA